MADLVPQASALSGGGYAAGHLPSSAAMIGNGFSAGGAFSSPSGASLMHTGSSPPNDNFSKLHLQVRTRNAAMLTAQHLHLHWLPCGGSIRAHAGHLWYPLCAVKCWVAAKQQRSLL